jgi:hypothetical protein
MLAAIGQKIKTKNTENLASRTESRIHMARLIKEESEQTPDATLLLLSALLAARLQDSAYILYSR